MMRFILRGRRSIWCSWRVTLLAPRIGNDVSYVTRINDEIHFAWQAQCLVQLEGDVTCNVSYVTRITDEIHFAWQAQYYLLHALEMTFHMSRGSMMRFILHGRRSTWCSWRVTLLAPRIGNDVSYVTRITDEIHFAWAVFGEVGVWLFVAAPHLVQFWEIAGARNVVFFNTKSSPGSQGEGLRSGGCEMTILSSDYPRIMLGLSSDHARIVFLLAETFQYWSSTGVILCIVESSTGLYWSSTGVVLCSTTELYWHSTL